MSGYVFLSGGYLLVGLPETGRYRPHQQPPEKEKTYDMSGDQDMSAVGPQELPDRPGHKTPETEGLSCSSCPTAYDMSVGHPTPFYPSWSTVVEGQSMMDRTVWPAVWIINRWRWGAP